MQGNKKVKELNPTIAQRIEALVSDGYVVRVGSYSERPTISIWAKGTTGQKPLFAGGLTKVEAIVDNMRALAAFRAAVLVADEEASR